MAPCRPFLFISFSCGFRLSSSNRGFFFGCGVQLAPHSLPPDSLRSRPSFPSSDDLEDYLGRLPQLHYLAAAAGVERMNAWIQSQTRPRRTSCLFGKHPPTPTPGKRKSPGRQQRAGVPFVSVELRDHQLAQGREPRPNRAMEQSLLRSWLPSCRGAFGSPL